MEDYKKLLEDFYSKYNPEKISEVQGLLTKYKGQEEELLVKLHDKYKVKNYHKLFRDFYSKHNPEKISEVTDLLKKYEGQEEELLMSLSKKYKVTQEVFADVKPNITSSKKTNNESANNETTRLPKKNAKIFVIVGIIALASIAVIVAALFIFGSSSMEKDAKKLAELTWKVEHFAKKVDSGDNSVLPEVNRLSEELKVRLTDMQKKYPKDGGGPKFAAIYEKAFAEISACPELIDNEVKNLEKLEVTDSDSPESKAYNEAIESGEQAIKDGRLNVAIMQFKVAESLKPEEKLPQQRIKEIEAMNSSSPYFIVTAKKTYFYHEPDSSTQKNAYLIVGQRFLGWEVKNGFVAAEFTNAAGNQTNGWIKISDVKTETKTDQGDLLYTYKADANGEADIQLKIYEYSFELYFKNFEGKYEKTYTGKVTDGVRMGSLTLTFGTEKPDLTAFFYEKYDENDGFEVYNKNTVEIVVSSDVLYLWGISCPKK